MLIDLAAPLYGSWSITMPASGAISAPVNLRTPGLAGAEAYLQAAVFPPAGGPLVSNGLWLGFAP